MEVRIVQTRIWDVLAHMPKAPRGSEKPEIRIVQSSRPSWTGFCTLPAGFRSEKSEIRNVLRAFGIVPAAVRNQKSEIRNLKSTTVKATS